MKLLRAEARRLWKRRLTTVLLVFVLGLVAVTAAAVGFYSERPSPQAREQAQAEAAVMFQEQQQQLELEFEDCQLAKATGQPPALGYDHPANCAEILTWSTPEAEMVNWLLPPVFDFAADFPALLMVLIALLSLYAFLVGASFVGAEWRSGGMLNLLLWHPRRVRVLGTKLGVLLASLFGLTAVLGMGWTGGLWVLARVRGVTDGVDPELWRSIAATGLRGLVFVLFAGAVGFALASIGRHTAAALGALLAAFVVGVVGVAAVLSGLGVATIEYWLWPTYVAAWLEGTYVVYDWSNCTPDGECVERTVTVTWQWAGAVLGTGLLALLAAAGWHLRYRDVT